MKNSLVCILFFIFSFSLTIAQTTPNSEKEHEIGPNDFVVLEKEPAPINLDELKKMIGYPKEALEKDIAGKVVIRMMIDEKGNYVKHIIIKDPNPILSNAVSSKISALRFTPGIQNGKPIRVWVTIPFDFKLLGKNGTNGQADANVKHVYYDLTEALAAPDPAQVLELYLNGKDMRQFPKEVLNFPNLQKLELGDNALTVLPPDLKSLTNLRYLGLTMNRFTALPEFIWSMPALVQVNATQNPFAKGYAKKLEKEHGEMLVPKDSKGKVVW
jgi:TonB family protein